MQNSCAPLPMVAAYISKAEEGFQPAFELLRETFLSEGPTEVSKCSVPCLSYKGLICSTESFKKHTGTGLFQGAVIADPMNLIECKDGTKALRSIKFNAVSLISKKVTRASLEQSISLNENGIKVDLKKDHELIIADHLKEALAKNKKAATAFKEFSYSH